MQLILFNYRMNGVDEAQENEYQQILCFSYVFNLVNNTTEIVKLEELFYIRDSNKNLHLIQKRMNKCYSRVEQILKTCIYFEKYKNKPLDSYICLQKNSSIITSRGIDYELFKQLQLQYIIDKSYFNH
jgi:hypothetical protein